ncbi:hypothetical protein NC653_037967 [Populus alba x Populus x berolinensis]|uniref:Secreted protein n=1 Tax=Populus alba x Populus x berolinensis TaxID=444605 RepID=A0AAD6LFF8_9ROSI|nr:hypothetical protein NC653_037967 [Populus alba x Populus x berolinensis]
MKRSLYLQGLICGLFLPPVLPEWNALVLRCRVCVRTMIYGSTGTWRSLEMRPKHKVLATGKLDQFSRYRCFLLDLVAA